MKTKETSNQKQFQIAENSTYGADSKNHPVNRKQFVKLDESLFKAYIDKMPESESLSMIKIIYENKLPDCKFKSHLDKWFKL